MLRTGFESLGLVFEAYDLGLGVWVSGILNLSLGFKVRGIWAWGVGGFGLWV